MTNFVKSLIGLASICTTSACAGNLLLQKPDTVIAAHQVASDGKHDREDKGGAHNMTTDLFMVFWTIDYGYGLDTESDMEAVILPEFDNDDVLNKFDMFFSNENSSLIVGKRIFCECVGEWFEKNGIKSYRIHDARLFAK